MEYLLHLFILIGIYTMLAQTLNISAGFGGMISLAHAGFYGIGAYTAAILSVNCQVPFLFVLLVAMLISGLSALLVSAVAIRTVDDYFIICTLGIQVVIFSLMNNWMSLTRGPLGIPGIPPLQIFGIEINGRIPLLLLTLFFTAIVFVILHFITQSSFGRTLRTLSENEIFAQSLGKNVYAAKIAAFTMSAMLAAIPGVLYAHYISYIDPTSFTVDESIFILSIVIIDGMRNLWGSALAAAFLVLLPEMLRFVGLPNSIAANLRQIIYGAILIFTMFRYCQEFAVKTGG